MSKEQLTEEELNFLDIWYTPKAMLEILFHNWDNLNSFHLKKYGELRLYQEAMLSDESIIDFDLTAKMNGFDKQEIFDCRKRVGDIYCFGARKFGKSLITIILDTIVQMFTNPADKVALGSVDLIHIKRVLDPIKNCFESHPICKIWKKRIVGAPDYQITLKNDWNVTSVNSNIGSKNPGQNYLGLHSSRIILEEQSMETDEVYEKRKDSIAEVGAVIRCIAKGSKILMSDLSSKNIEDIKIGDKILAWNEEKSNLDITEVLKTFEPLKKDVIAIESQKSILWLTPEHKFYGCSNGHKVWRWIESIYSYKNIYQVMEIPFFANDVIKCQTYKNNILKHKRAYFYTGKIKFNGFQSQIDTYDLTTGLGNFIANGFIVHNCSGMTNFTVHSPSGKLFYDQKLKTHVINLPQMVNPTFNEDKQKKLEEEYSGKSSIGYRVFVNGEIVEDGVSVFDMQRVRELCVNAKKSIRLIEIAKEDFKFYKQYLVCERPNNSERIFINSDIGVHTTEINIMSEVKDKYEYLYNISLHNLTDDEQATIFKYLIEQLKANVVAIDCGDGTGRSIYNELEKTIPKTNLVWYDGKEKIPVGFQINEDGTVLYKEGIPLPKEERMAEWSVKRLKDLFYEGRLIIPEDYKFISQFSQVIAITSGDKILYRCNSPQGDHLFDSFKVFAIAEWLKSDANQTPNINENWGGGING